MRILSLDFESTWQLDTTKTQITEIGAVLYCTERKSPVGVFSQFVWEPEYPVSPPELVNLTGIDDELLKEFGTHPQLALSGLNAWMQRADYVLAHNGNNFDKPIYYNQCEKYAVPPINLEWIDSRIDIPYPGNIKARNLVHLAAEHGFLNPFSHRALFDAMTTLEVLKRYSLEDVLRLMKEPVVRCVAKVSFEDKDKAKARSYSWDSGKRYWFKDLKESFVQEEVSNAPFVIVEVEKQ